MTVEVISDVGGHTMTLIVNGARLTMDLVTAEKVIQSMTSALDRLYYDHVAKQQQEAVYKRFGK